MGKTSQASSQPAYGSPGIRERVRRGTKNWRSYMLRPEKSDEKTTAASKREASEENRGGMLPSEIDGFLGENGVLNQLGDILQDHEDSLNALRCSIDDLNKKVEKMQLEIAKWLERQDQLPQEDSRLLSENLAKIQKCSEQENRKEALVSAVDIYCKKSSESLAEFLSVVNLLR